MTFVDVSHTHQDMLKVFVYAVKGEKDISGHGQQCRAILYN